MDTTYHVTLFGLEMDIDRVAFTLPFGENGWPIYWYGILISLGFLALISAFRNTKRFGIDNDRLIDCILVTTPLAILGARAYYLLFDGGGIQGFKKFFSIHDGGLAIYGGVITAVAVGALMCKIRRVKIADVLDLTALGFLIGQAVGRWGNFFNQEAFGRYVQGSHLPDWWGMTSEAVADFYFDGVMVHPCFLYESIWCLLGFILLHILSRHRKFSGQIALGYGVWYGVGRFFIEGPVHRQPARFAAGVGAGRCGLRHAADRPFGAPEEGRDPERLHAAFHCGDGGHRRRCRGAGERGSCRNAGNRRICRSAENRNAG